MSLKYWSMSSPAAQIIEGRSRFNEKYHLAELHGLTIAADRIVVDSIKHVNRDAKITEYSYGGFKVEMVDKRGEFRGLKEEDRIDYALSTIVEEDYKMDWSSTFDKTIDEVNPMYVPHVHEDISDPSSYEVGKLLASGLTHSGAHLHEGNTLLCQAIASPLTNKKLNMTTGVVEILEHPAAYYDTSVVTRLLKDYYGFAKDGISGPAYLINSRSARKKNVKDEDEELQKIHVDKGILPTQEGTVEVRSKDVNVAKKVTSCVIAFSSAACQFEESGYKTKDVIYNLVLSEPNAVKNNSELLVVLDDVPLFDFSSFKNQVKMLRKKKDRTLLEDGVLLHYDGIGVKINGSEVRTLSEKNDVMGLIQTSLLSERLQMHHRLLNLGNRILITDQPLDLDAFNVVNLGDIGTGERLTEIINEEFIMKGRDVKDYTSYMNVPKQTDWTDDVYDYWDHDGILEKTMFEVLQHVLSGNPDKQLKKYKSTFSTLMNFIFAKAKSGTGVTYISSRDKHNNTEITGYGTYEIAQHDDGGVYNDADAYEGMRSTLDAEFADLKENGFIHTYTLLKELIEPVRITRWHWRARTNRS